MKNEFDRLINHFQPNPKPSRQFAEEWAGKMKVFSLDIIKETVQHHIDNFQPSPHKFPAISDFFEIAHSINYNRKKGEQKKTDEQSWDNVMTGRMGTNSELAKQACLLIQALNSGKITRREFVEGIGMMDAPGAEKCKFDMIRFYDFYGLSLDNKISLNEKRRVKWE